MSLTVSELADAIRQIQQDGEEIPPNAVTTAQLAAHLSLNQAYVSKLVSAACSRGLWEYKGRFPVQNITGTVQPRPFYGPINPL